MRFDAATWAAVVGIFMPPLVAFVQKPDWSKLVRMLPPALVSLIVGALTCYFAGQLTPGDIVSSIFVTFTTAVTTYHLWWKKTVAEKIEQRSSAAPQP